jgi:hypothetical protein
MQPSVTCLPGMEMNTTSGMQKMGLACVEGLDVILAESAGNPLIGEYEAVLGFGQPNVSYFDENSTAQFDDYEIAGNFMLQLHLQYPHIDARACFNYYWNNSNSTNSSQMFIGSVENIEEFCVPNFEHYMTVTTASTDNWALESYTWLFGDA